MEVLCFDQMASKISLEAKLARVDALCSALYKKFTAAGGYKSRSKAAKAASAACTRGMEIAKRIRTSLVRQPSSGARPEEMSLWDLCRRAKDWHTRKRTRQIQAAMHLAREAGVCFNEAASGRGDHLFTIPLDFIPPQIAIKAPYCDMGGRGLGLVRVERTRVYAKSSKWRPRSTSTVYLVGRNETGSFFAHAVPQSTTQVVWAMNWIWQGRGYDIIARQGDIALIKGAGPKIPKLPDGHVLGSSSITHDQHPDLPLPKKGERVIVAHRAVARVSEETRD